MRPATAVTGNLVFLVRHGTAEDAHPAGDDARALTREGRDAFRSLVRGMTKQLQGAAGIRNIATSPLVRAVQTAEILADACGINTVVSEPALGVDAASPQTITALVRKLGPGWAFVGHNPSLGATLGAWIGEGQAVRFRKGGVCALTLSANGAPPYELVFMATPGRPQITTVAALTA